MPRPRFLDETKQHEICALVHAGCTLAAVADYVGCSVLTIRREARRNREFSENLRRKRMSSDLQPICAVREAANSDWRAAAWLLERTQPQHYARRAAISFSPQDVAELLDRVCEVIRQETRDAQKFARIKRRVMTLAHSKIARHDGNPFRAQFPAPPPHIKQDSPDNRPVSGGHDSPSSSEVSKPDQNVTETEPVLICLGDVPPSKSRPFAPAYASI